MHLAASLYRAPFAAITFIDRDRQWVKASVGLDMTHTERASGLCSYTIQSAGPLRIEDARADPRFSSHAWVTGGPQIRCYCGVPIVTADGYAVGTLAGMDGFVLGAHGGYLGRLSSSLDDTSASGFTLGGDALVRFAKVIVAGATFDVGSIDRTATVLGAARIGFFTHPEKTAFTLSALAGGRSVGRGVGGGGAFGGSIGFTIPIAGRFRLDPRLDLAATSVGDTRLPLLFLGLGFAYDESFPPALEGPQR